MFCFTFSAPIKIRLIEKHLLQVDVMKKVATVRVVKDNRHREPGMQGNQGDELTTMRCYLIFTSEMTVVTHFWIHYRGAWEVVEKRWKQA